MLPSSHQKILDAAVPHGLKWRKTAATRNFSIVVLYTSYIYVKWWAAFSFTPSSRQATLWWTIEIYNSQGFFPFLYTRARGKENEPNAANLIQMGCGGNDNNNNYYISHLFGVITAVYSSIYIYIYSYCNAYVFVLRFGVRTQPHDAFAETRHCRGGK